MKRICTIIGLQAVVTSHSIAADLPVKAPVPYLARQLLAPSSGWGMSGIPPLSSDKQTFGQRAKNDASDRNSGV
jgi:hypothetical protein